MNSRAFTKAYTRAYSEISGEEVDSIEQIPDRALRFISRIPIRQLLIPIVQDELMKGKSRKEVSIYLDIPTGLTRWIGIQCGHFKATSQ
jgi:hypothetical protein